MASQETIEERVVAAVVRERVRGGMARLAAVFFLTRLAGVSQQIEPPASVARYVATYRARLSESVLAYANATQHGSSEIKRNQARHALEDEWKEFVGRVAMMLVPELYVVLAPYEAAYDAIMPRPSMQEHAALLRALREPTENTVYDVSTLDLGISSVDLDGTGSDFERVNTELRALRPARTPDDAHENHAKTAAAFMDHMCGTFVERTLDAFEKKAKRGRSSPPMAGVLASRLIQELELQVMLLAMGQYKDEMRELKWMCRGTAMARRATYNKPRRRAFPRAMDFYCNNVTGACIAAADLVVELCGAGNATGDECEEEVGVVGAVSLVVIVALGAACAVLGAKLHAALTQQYVSADELLDGL